MSIAKDSPSAAHPRREPSWTGMARVVRPTLVAAIGGTGTAAAKAALQRIEHFVGTRHHYIAFRAFDTAFQDNRPPRFVDNAEYVYLGGFNAQSVIADIVAGRAFPHWAQWLPPRLNFQQVAFGAGGIRPIGRLCYFYRRDRIEAAVQDALTTITDSDRALRFHQQSGIRVNLEAGIDIHVIGSVCGGTGSGMFLDLAFDLRRWAEQHTNREVTVTGHLVLPEAFRGKPVVMKALEANACIALQELDRFMNAASDDPWTVEYVRNRTERSWRAPFDHCYLLSGLQQGGTADIDTLTAEIGEAITLFTLSQTGQKVLEGVINMAGQRKSTRDEQGRVCCYSSYGVLGLEIPEELLGEALGHTLAAELHRRLLKGGTDAETVPPEDVQKFKEALQINDLRRLEELLPALDPDLGTVHALLGDKRRHEAGKAELQRALIEAHDFQRRERRRTGQPLWEPDALRSYMAGRVRENLLKPGGLVHNLCYFDRCVDALRAFQKQVRDGAQEADDLAGRNRAKAVALEEASLSGRELTELLDKDVEAWREYVKNETRATVFRDQLARIEGLVSTLEQELIAPWKRIKDMLDTLRVDQPRDEEAYYRVNRARASVGPLRWFGEHLILPNQERLLKELLPRLIEESRQWATIESKDLNDRFYALCTEAIQHFFDNEAAIDCDRLLADCHGYPEASYRTEIAVLLSRAVANWEVHESYGMRENKLEISSLGARVDSRLYGAVRESYSQISPVDEQRDDYIPILRTEHGLSLLGLKSLSAYRRSLLGSVVEEQRYDFHFFNDRRWVTRLEFATEDREELRLLYLFSAADLLKLLGRDDGIGYRVADEEKPLGRYRREAFVNFSSNRSRLEKIEEKIREQSKNDPEWRQKLEKQIGRLEEILAIAAAPSQGTNHFLSLDIYQLHAEIRALKAELRIENLGL